MRRHLLSNRIRGGILLAILLQSVIFGIGLVMSGTFSDTVKRPYKVMESHSAEKNSLISNYMNNALLTVDSMVKELENLTDEQEIQNRLVDNLNNMYSSSALFFLDLDKNEAVMFEDGEPDIYSLGYGDITCKVGNPVTTQAVALSKNWIPDISQEDWDKVYALWEKRSQGGRWFFGSDKLYYLLPQEAKTGRRILGLQISSATLNSYLRLDDPPYEGMKLVLLSEDRVLYSGQQGMVGKEYSVSAQEQHIHLESAGVMYDGVRTPLETYGYMNDGNVYIGAICYHSQVQALSYTTQRMVAAIYVLSIGIALVFSCIAIWMILKPIQKLQEDITGQKPEEIYFPECGIVEIDGIYKALNDMARRLEQSHSRYRFAMEAASDNVGSFEYTEDGRWVKLSGALCRILDISRQKVRDDDTMHYTDWQKVIGKLSAIEELENGYSFFDEKGEERAISMKERREEDGVFGMVIDKTEEYREITRLRSLSQHDQLTGLYNGIYLRKEGQRILNLNRNHVNALVFCDLDALKYVNDNFGHEMGDQYLKTMAAMLVKIAASERCIPVRISGDEFIMFFYGYDNREYIEKCIRDAYEARPAIDLPDGSCHRINASMGLAYAQRGDERIENLMSRADKAMYRVKHGTKNGLAVYDKTDEECME